MPVYEFTPSGEIVMIATEPVPPGDVSHTCRDGKGRNICPACRKVELEAARRRLAVAK